MTTDDVVLRRHKLPHPHPNRGQSAYMTLLSSLATDLDLMLNDLRSSPTSRFLQPSTIRSTQSILPSQRLNSNILVRDQQQQTHRDAPPPPSSSSTSSSTQHSTQKQQIFQQQQHHHHHHVVQQQQHHQPFRLHQHQHNNNNKQSGKEQEIVLDCTTVTSTTSTTSQTAAFLGDSASTSTGERSLLWSSETTSSTHQQLKSRRLPFSGVDAGGGGGGGGGGGVVGSNGASVGNNSIATTNLIGSNKSNGNGGDNIGVGVESLDSMETDGGCCGDGLIEDDLQALLPNCRQLSRDELCQSRASLVSSSDGGVLAEGETSSETSEGSTSPPCDLGLVERLLRTHPVWFLPGIQRAGAVHLLQGKEEGNFIVRGSSQPNTMAVSVRLPPDTGPYIEHYLIQSNENILSLESSRFKFDSIPALIAHYAQCCDELPVQLTLPRALREAKNRQQISSLALLGQEFWRYPMANPKPSSNSNSNSNIVEAKSPNSLTDTSGIGTTVFSSTITASQHSQQSQQTSQSSQMKIFSPTNPLNGVFSQAGTPSDTTSSLSSFTTSTGHNQQLMSPESIDSVVLTMSPNEGPTGGNRAPINGGANSGSNKLTTFKSTNQMKFCNTEQVIRAQRPTPPNTLNLGPLRTPPAPPVRWSKPLTPISPVTPPQSGPLLQAPPPNSDPSHMAGNNFTVTTTVTFSVDNKNSQQFVEVTSPTVPPPAVGSSITSSASTTTFQTFSKRLSPEGECKTTVDSLSSQGSSNRWQSQSSKDSNPSQRKILSPSSAETPTSGRQKKSKAKKESKHYQESDILESPQVYCRSALGDKISDYEDLWSQDTTQVTTPMNRSVGQLSSFRPDGIQGKRPDLLPETPTITSLSCNVLSPANSVSSSNPSPPMRQNQQSADNLNNNNNNNVGNVLSPSIETNKNFPQSNDNNQNPPQTRNRLGLMLPLGSGLGSEDMLNKSSLECDTNGVSNSSRSKQGSPFYAEPADALRAAAAANPGIGASILRRSQRNVLIPPNHRHSEPPKGGITRTPVCPVFVPSEIEKIAGSLDELKKKQQKRLRGRLDPWPLDSSWEFMGNNETAEDEYGDYDSQEQWNVGQSKSNTASQVNGGGGGSQTHQNSNNNNNNNNNINNNNVCAKSKPLTVHQIIARRLPDLNLPELIRCSTPQKNDNVINERGLSSISNNNSNINNNNNNNNNNNLSSCNSNPSSNVNANNSGHRISSYDNVERNNGGNLSYTTSFLNGLDSAQSDDGTVFSEPWDSSQWDSFIPHDDTSDTIHLSKCRAALSASEDDTIIEETLKDNQGTLKANKLDNQHKIATILRSRSCRDREILCHPRNKSHSGGPGDSVGSYTLQLANDHTSTFSRNIENFIACTKESREAAPQVVMRNMRQFMSGMKNYLVKHGEGDFQQEVQKARSRLKSDEFLNLDAILEAVMHQLVVLPLREHLYGMFVDYYTRSGDIQLLVENVKYACARNPADFGIQPSVTPPTSMALHQISLLLLRLQEAELPLEKLELFLLVISAIFDATGCPRGQQLGADDFLPILVFVVAKCGFVGAEIEAEFMWGLLQPPLLSGEAGYYLTALCSAVHVLKSFMASDSEGTGSLDWRSSSLPACSSVLRVIIPDECNGSLQTRTLPVRPHTTTREVCRIIAHRARITNPQDYGLFKLVDGEETLLADSECPQDARIAARGKHCMLAYKRIDAKIAWPTSTTASYS